MRGVGVAELFRKRGPITRLVERQFIRGSIKQQRSQYRPNVKCNFFGGRGEIFFGGSGGV